MALIRDNFMKIKEKKEKVFVMSEKISNFASRFYPILIANVGEDRDFGRFHLTCRQMR